MAKLDDDIDALFRVPLTEFIGARQTLTARLKKDGLASEAARVKLLAKPSISAWTVNQLYWTHREAFDELIATGQRFRKAQTSGKNVNMREALEARREALSHLSDLATEILRDAGHNPSLDVLRRINSTLEALSASTSLSEGPIPGRLTHDVDPPGFDSFGSFVPSSVTRRAAESPQAGPAKKSVTGPSTRKQKAVAEASRREERQAKINSAKASLQDARKSLTAARAMAKSLEAAQKRSEATAKEAEKQRHHAKERLKRASAASEEAAQRAESIAVELKEATKAMEEAQRNVEKATKELEISFRESPGTGRK